MKANELRSWQFTIKHEHIQDTDYLECPQCTSVSRLEKWRLGHVYCETCGGHDALRCPACNWLIDHIDQNPEQLRIVRK